MNEPEPAPEQVSTAYLWDELERLRIESKRAEVASLVTFLILGGLGVVMVPALILTLGSGDYGPRATGATSMVASGGELLAAILVLLLSRFSWIVFSRGRRAALLLEKISGLGTSHLGPDEARRQRDYAGDIQLKVLVRIVVSLILLVLNLLLFVLLVRLLAS